VPAAFGEGRLDGLFRGILGILIGAGLYSEVYPLIQDNFLKLGDYGKLTFPNVLGFQSLARDRAVRDYRQRNSLVDGSDRQAQESVMQESISVTLVESINEQLLRRRKCTTRN
jgi:hypothetical protein